MSPTALDVDEPWLFSLHRYSIRGRGLTSYSRGASTLVTPSVSRWRREIPRRFIVVTSLASEQRERKSRSSSSATSTPKKNTLASKLRRKLRWSRLTDPRVAKYRRWWLSWRLEVRRPARWRPCTPFGFYNSYPKLDKTTAYEPKLGTFVEGFRGRKGSDIRELRRSRAPAF